MMPVAVKSDRMPGAASRRRQFDHVYFTVMSILMTAGVGLGFSRTYFTRIAAGTTTPLIHIHGAVFAAWMVLFVTQAVLVAAGNTRLHRRIGVAGVFFAVLMLVLGSVTGIVAARHGYTGPFPIDAGPLAFLLVAPVRDMLVFGALTGAAIVLRRDIESHKRLMVMATLGGLAPAGFVRISGETVGITLVIVLLLAGPAYDWLVHKRVYAAYVWGIAVSILSTAAFAWMAQTAVWQSFARTLVE